MFRMVQCCVFGDETSTGEAKRSIFPCLSGSTTTATAVKLAICTIGSFLVIFINVFLFLFISFSFCQNHIIQLVSLFSESHLYKGENKML